MVEEFLSANDLGARTIYPFYCYATRDPFYDQFLANADAAQQAGVAVERLQLDEMPHGFGASGGWIPTYDQWLSRTFSEND